MNSKCSDRFRTLRIARILKFKLSILKQLSKPALNQIINSIRENGINLVIDVGANVGQFGTDLRNTGYKGKLISFEPASEPFLQLLKRSQKDALWSVFNLGVGNRIEEIDLHLASNSGLSSSILKPGLHSNFFPGIRFDRTEKIQITTLSNFIKDQKLQECRILLKVDAQGYEGLILEGALEIFDSVISTYLELSLVELYCGEVGALAILNTLSNLGHDISDIRRGIESKSRKLLQIDVLTTKRAR